MKYLLSLLLLISLHPRAVARSTPTELSGAWESSYVTEDQRVGKLLMIIQDGYFAMTSYVDSSFQATLGGSYLADDQHFTVRYEFDSADPAAVGPATTMDYHLTGNLLLFNGSKAWNRIDEGRGELAGAWIITGRKRNGEMTRRETSGPRKTMKILSGSRFQWIAFNTATGEFHGTGGGRYELRDGRLYLEKIDFFSRDDSRVGQQLSFDYKVRNQEWHHSGLSSKGQPMYETWGRR